jgi:hypothetical protein
LGELSEVFLQDKRADGVYVSILKLLDDLKYKCTHAYSQISECLIVKLHHKDSTQTTEFL